MDEVDDDVDADAVFADEGCPAIFRSTCAGRPMSMTSMMSLSRTSSTESGALNCIPR
jgi:hypothetical protein